MFLRKTTGFTLVELLVVMAIIGILAAALITPVTNALETARTAKCKANLKNLAQAAASYAVATERMPWAGSYEWYWPTERGEIRYYERSGWVGWTGSGRWPSGGSLTSQCGKMEPAKFWKANNGATDLKPFLSITNGVLWSYVGGDLATYVCDKHKKTVKRSVTALRSYVMNGYFGYSNNGNGKLPQSDRLIRLDSVTARGSAANLLLFAEIPAYTGNHVPNVDTSAKASDGVLETDIRKYDDPDSTAYLNKTTAENIGFNHFVGKRYVAHVVFVDGHVDVLVEPKGAADADLKKLTKELCNGDEIDQDLRTKQH